MCRCVYTQCRVLVSFKEVLLCDVTSNTMLFLLSLRVQLFIIFFLFKAKKLWGSGRSQEFIKKPHFKNGSTKISVLEVRIDSMQHFFPLFLFQVYGLSLILVGWDGADAFKLIL